MRGFFGPQLSVKSDRGVPCRGMDERLTWASSYLFLFFSFSLMLLWDLHMEEFAGFALYLVIVVREQEKFCFCIQPCFLRETYFHLSVTKTIPSRPGPVA